MRGQGGGLGGARVIFFSISHHFLGFLMVLGYGELLFLMFFFLNFFYDSNSPLALYQHQNGV